MADSGGSPLPQAGSDDPGRLSGLVAVPSRRRCRHSAAHPHCHHYRLCAGRGGVAAPASPPPPRLSRSGSHPLTHPHTGPCAPAVSNHLCSCSASDPDLPKLSFPDSMNWSLAPAGHNSTHPAQLLHISSASLSGLIRLPSPDSLPNPSPCACNAQQQPVSPVAAPLLCLLVWND